MRLLVTTSTFPKWENDSTPPFIYDLSKRLTKEYEVHVLAPYSDKSKRYEEREGLFIHRYKFFPGRKFFTDGAIVPFLRKNPLYYFQVPFFFVKQFLEVRRLVKKYKIDQIQAHWIIPQGLVAVVYKKLFNRNIKITMTSLGADIFGLKNSILMKLKKWTLNNSKGLVTSSNVISEEAYKLGCNDIPVEFIPMGVDISKCTPDNYDEGLKRKYGIAGHFLLFVGRLSEKKGCKYLLNAMPNIIKEFSDIKLIIIGSGEDEKSLHRLANELGLFDKSVIFIGSVAHSDLPKYYATCDILIGPSVVASGGDSDGLPVVFIEALCSGAPILTTDMETLTDLIVDGKTGFTVKQKDSDNLCEKVIYLLKNKELCDKVSSQGRDFVLKNFDWDVITRRHIDFFSKSL